MRFWGKYACAQQASWPSARDTARTVLRRVPGSELPPRRLQGDTQTRPSDPAEAAATRCRSGRVSASASAITALSAPCARTYLVARSQACYEGFIPCRDERCSETDLHPAHSSDQSKRLTECPSCSSDIIPLPKKRAKCTRCSWSGSRVRELGAKKDSVNA